MSGIYFYTKEEEEAKRRYWCNGKSDIKLHIHNPTTVTVSTTSTRKRVEGKKDFLKNSFFFYFQHEIHFHGLSFIFIIILFCAKGKAGYENGHEGKIISEPMNIK